MDGIVITGGRFVVMMMMKMAVVVLGYRVKG